MAAMWLYSLYIDAKVPLRDKLCPFPLYIHTTSIQKKKKKQASPCLIFLFPSVFLFLSSLLFTLPSIKSSLKFCLHIYLSLSDSVALWSQRSLLSPFITLRSHEFRALDYWYSEAILRVKENKVHLSLDCIQSQGQSMSGNIIWRKIERMGNLKQAHSYLLNLGGARSTINNPWYGATEVIRLFLCFLWVFLQALRIFLIHRSW